jgi:hypothetical protein
MARLAFPALRVAGGIFRMTDQELMIDALEEARRILADYIEAGARLRPESTVNKLLRVLDRQDLALAQERLKVRCGLQR